MPLPRPDMPLWMPLLPEPVEEIGGMKLLPLDGPLMLMPPLLEEEPLPGATPAGMTWDATPKLAGVATPTPKKQAEVAVG